MTNEEIWLYKRSGSGGGTTIIPNPEGTATDDLEKIQIGDDIYAIPQPDLTNYLTLSDVGAVALSNNYNDLDNKPAIPIVNTEMTLAQYNQLTPQQKNDGTIRYITDASGGVVANELDDLDNVSISNPADGQAILYDSQNDTWYNGDVGSSGGGINYSTTEIDTGDTWDGKPIYAKMLKGTTPSVIGTIDVFTISGRVLSMTGWFGASADNAVKAPIVQGFTSSTGGGDSNDLWYLSQNTKGAVTIFYKVTNRNYEILLKYTKTA